MSDDWRIEDMFEPLSAPDQPEPKPQSLDDAVERYGFDDVYAALQRVVGEEEQR